MVLAIIAEGAHSGLGWVGWGGVECIAESHVCKHTAPAFWDSRVTCFFSTACSEPALFSVTDEERKLSNNPVCK